MSPTASMATDGGGGGGDADSVVGDGEDEVLGAKLVWRRAAAIPCQHTRGPSDGGDTSHSRSSASRGDGGSLPAVEEDVVIAPFIEGEDLLKSMAAGCSVDSSWGLGSSAPWPRILVAEGFMAVA